MCSPFVTPPYSLNLLLKRGLSPHLLVSSWNGKEYAPLQLFFLAPVSYWGTLCECRVRTCKDKPKDYLYVWSSLAHFSKPCSVWLCYLADCRSSLQMERSQDRALLHQKVCSLLADPVCGEQLHPDVQSSGLETSWLQGVDKGSSLPFASRSTCREHCLMGWRRWLRSVVVV